MDAILKRYYGDSPTPEQTKQASAAVEMFHKLAEQNGIDLTKLSDEEAGALWMSTFDAGEKVAEFPPPSPEEKAEKKDEKTTEKDEKKDEEAEKKAAAELAELRAQAEREFSEKRAASEKVAEFEELGRIAARAFVSELEKAAAAATPEAPAGDPKLAAMGEAFKAQIAKMKEGKKDGDDGHKEPDADDKKEEKAEKEASAIDKLALAHAFELIESWGKGNGLSEEKVAEALKVADERLSAVLTLHGTDLPGGTKVAHAISPEAAIVVRSLEFLDAAGYPVDWSKV